MNEDEHWQSFVVNFWLYTRPDKKILLRPVTCDLPVLFEQQLDPEATAMAAFPSRDREAFCAHSKKVHGDGFGHLEDQRGGRSGGAKSFSKQAAQYFVKVLQSRAGAFLCRLGCDRHNFTRKDLLLSPVLGEGIE
jgi:hypothetical protein